MNVPYFAMFSDEGNLAVQEIVNVAMANRLTWPETYNLLVNLAQKDYKNFGEATDTAVREMVYDACGFQTAFYV